MANLSRTDMDNLWAMLDDSIQKKLSTALDDHRFAAQRHYHKRSRHEWGDYSDDQFCDNFDDHHDDWFHQDRDQDRDRGRYYSSPPSKQVDHHNFYSSDSGSSYSDSYSNFDSSYTDDDFPDPNFGPSGKPTPPPDGTSASLDPTPTLRSLDVLLAKYAATAPQEDPYPTGPAILPELLPQINKWLKGYVAPSEIKISYRRKLSIQSMWSRLNPSRSIQNFTMLLLNKGLSSINL